MSRLAVVLFNLGGPDRLSSVEPFLFNLFNDPEIIGAPGPLRWLLARLLSRRRRAEASTIYKRLGGKSPLLENTRLQAEALETSLSDSASARVFIAMRHWHPMSVETAEAVKAFAPDEIVLLPLYPQFSTTTTGSSLAEWQHAAAAVGLEAPARAICCYPAALGFIGAVADLTRAGIAEAAAAGNAPRVLFSAHGLPQRVVRRGDPYQWQVEQTVAAVVAKLAVDDLDWSICYQSRVGPLKWIGPEIGQELERAAGDGVAVVVVPVAFVSEHLETLVELDIQFRDRARELGLPAYVRVPAVSTREAYIESLANLVDVARRGAPGVCTRPGGRACPAPLGRCSFGKTL
ncbi:MAG: ferrochelatase [Rhodospirillales bacterium]|nr:ferrochelatase [Rhodospirillales bacterium]